MNNPRPFGVANNVTMPKTDAEVLMGVLSTALKVDDGSLSELKEADGAWKDTAIEALVGMHAEHVKTVRGDVDKLKAERYSQGKREALEALERELREEFGVKEADKRGKDLVKLIVGQAAQANGITEEKIKTHPLYLKLEEEYGKLPQTFEQKMKQREEELRSEFEAERTLNAALDAGHTIFQGMNPVLPKDATVAKNQLRLLDDWIRSHKYTTIEEGGQRKFVPMKADGSGRMTDDHGHNMTFDDLVRQGARMYFEFQVGERKGSAPDPDRSGGGSGGSGKGQDPKTQAEYAAAWQAISDSAMTIEEKKKAWEELKEAGKRTGVVT